MFLANKQSLLTIVVIGLLSALVAASTNRPQDEIVVTEGTAINVVTAKEVTTKEAKPNDPVDFTIAEDLNQRTGHRS
jgi:hypothetical protein